MESEGLVSLIYGLFLDFYRNVPAFSADFNVGVSTREVGKAPNHQSQYLFTSQACVKGESNKNASVASLPGPMSLPIRRATSGPHCQQGSQPLHALTEMRYISLQAVQTVSSVPVSAC